MCSETAEQTEQSEIRLATCAGGDFKTKILRCGNPLSVPIAVCSDSPALSMFSGAGVLNSGGL